MALSDDPADAKFWTARPDIWLSACLQYYTSLYDNGTLKKRPEVRQDRYGKQVLVPDNRSPDSSCYVTVFVYKTGVVLIQGRGCGKWESSDMAVIKSLVNTLECEAHRSTTPDPVVNDQHFQDPASPSNSCSSLNLNDKEPSPQLSFVQRLYKAASFILPTSSSTPKIRAKDTTSDDMSDTAMLQHCSDISAAKISLDSTGRQQQLMNTLSTYSDLDTDSDNELLIIRCPSSMTSSSPKLPPPGLDHSLASQLKDAHHTISSFSSVKYQLQQKVQQLEINNNTLSTQCNELTEKCDTLRAQLISLQLEKEKSQFQKVIKEPKKTRALPTEPIHNKDDDVLIIGSSMVRQLAGELSKTHKLKSTGFVYPGSRCQRLTNIIPRTQSQHQPRKPNLVVLAGGTNNISAGDSVTKVCDNVNKMLKTAQDTYPSSKIVFSSIHHRVDLHDYIAANRKIDAVNNNVKHLCKIRGYMFMDNNIQSSAISPDCARLRDGLHLAASGVQQLAQRITNIVSSSTNQEKVPQCLSAPPHQTRIMMRDKYTAVPRNFMVRENVLQRKIPALMDLHLTRPCNLGL